mmetsp:Transcript_13328/g.31661  ORF Transcript_13328/g.31661 Transcript_13328/m.31661 type:complete len:273 (-) Transcript_13328:476-1294(-)
MPLMTVRPVPMRLVTVGLVTAARRRALSMIVAMIQRTVIATSTSVSYHLPEHLHLESAVSDSFSLDDRNRLTQSPSLMLRRIDNQMCCATDLAGSEFPNVEVMNGFDIFYSHQLIRHLVLIYTCRGLAHQRLHSAHHSRPGRKQHDHPKQTSAHWIGINPVADLSSCSWSRTNIEWFQPDAQSCHANPQRLNNVAYDVSQGGLHGNAVIVMGMPVATIVRVPVPQHLHQYQVHNQADRGNDKHQFPVDWFRPEKSWQCLRQQHCCKGPNKGH